MAFWNTKGLWFQNKNHTFPILRFPWTISQLALNTIAYYCSCIPNAIQSLQIMTLALDCHQMHSNELGNLYHSWCQGQINPLSTTYSMVNHLYMETNSIMKIWKENFLCFNQIWEDPMVAKLKFPSWSSYWKYVLF